MPLTPIQERQLRAFLRRLTAANGISAIPGGSGKALEAWVFMILADAARQHAGWTVSLREGDGSLLPSGAPFAFSGGPGAISNAVGQSGFVRIERNRGATIVLELHHGLQHLGRSGARHEWDIALLPSDLCASIRAGTGNYPVGLPLIGIECKDKSSSGDTNEMRQTVARMFDLTHVSQLSPPRSVRLLDELGGNGIGRRWPTYIQNFDSGYFAIVRVGGFQLGARRMSEYFKVKQVGHMGIGTIGVENVLRRSMEQLLDNIDQLL